MDAVRYVATNCLLTSLSCLRSRTPNRRPGCVSLPIRVVCSLEKRGCYEVVDGFKRLRSAIDEGKTKVAVVVEDASGPQAKRLLIKANTAEKTLTAMDESRVIASLLDQDKLTLVKIARLLERKRPWVSKRLALTRRLDHSLHQAVDENRLPVSLAYGLTAFKREDQLKLAGAILTAGLSATNGHALLATYRHLDEERRKELLADPLGALDELARAGARKAVPMSSPAQRRLQTCRELARLLEQFVRDLPSPAVSPAEARLLEAERKMTAARIVAVARHLLQDPGARDDGKGENP